MCFTRRLCRAGHSRSTCNADILRKYFSYPRKVVIEVLPLAAPFPSISLCNMRNLDTIVLNRLNRIFLQTNDIGAMLRQFVGDPPSNVTASPVDVGDNDTQPLFRRRRHSDDTPADGASDNWINLMKNVLWKSRRSRKSWPGFRTRKSSSSSSSSSSYTIQYNTKICIAHNDCQFAESESRAVTDSSSRVSRVN